MLGEDLVANTTNEGTARYYDYSDYFDIFVYPPNWSSAMYVILA